MTLTLPAQTLLGENFAFTVTFDNTDLADTGYGPYVDLYLPLSGIDGSVPAPGNDGISIVSATYGGLSAVLQTVNCNAGAVFTPGSDGITRTCPAAPGNYTGSAGYVWQLSILQLPFGSFVPTQPPATISVTAALSRFADLAQNLPIRAQPGFRYGSTPTGTVPPVPLVGGVTVANTSPTLLSMAKAFSGPENETATGPNFPRTYTLTVDIATAQTITNLDVSDNLPGSIQFVSVATAPASAAIDTPSTLTPGGLLTRRFASITGGAGASDATVTITFYVPDNNALGTAVVSHLSTTAGAGVPITNTGNAQGSWTPLDVRDGPQTPVASATQIFTARSLAIQKAASIVTDTGPAGTSPGDTVEYALQFQISDYFAYANLLISSDVLSDGQLLAATTPTLTITQNGGTSGPTDFAPANWTSTYNSPLTGQTLLTFDISAQLAGSGQLLGGLVADGAPADDGPTTGVVRFRAVVQDAYAGTVPSGNPSLDEGDAIGNTVTLSGDSLDTGTCGSGTCAPAAVFDEQDGSSAGLTIGVSGVTKTIYAVNGVVCAVQPCSGVQVAPGDTITYRIRDNLLLGDYENLVTTDYLPKPIFLATEVVGPFDATVSAAAPPAGSAKFGPADTMFARSGHVPSISTDATANTVAFGFGTWDDPANTPGVIDLLLTVTVQPDPFADGLFLTNQVQTRDNNSESVSSTGESLVQLLITEPVLAIRKGVINTDGANPTYAPPGRLPANVNVSAPGGACPRLSGVGMPVRSTLLGPNFNSNLSGVDAGDSVTFSILVENTGRGLNGAFDIRLRDTLPTGFSPTMLGPENINLCVTDGTGAPIAYTNIGSGLFDPAGGIELTDPGPTNPPAGALDPGRDAAGALVTTGRNIAILTYDLILDGTVAPSQALTNTATLFNYAGREGGPNHVPTPRTDVATVTIRTVAMTKFFELSSEAHTTDSPLRLAIGEVARYRLVAQLPEGTSTNFQIRDLLANNALADGMTFIDDGTARVAFVTNGVGLGITSVGVGTLPVPAIPPGCTLSGAAADATTPAAPLPCVLADANVGSSNSTSADPDTYLASGTDPFFKLGSLTNADRDADAEFVVVEFNAITDNIANNAHGRVINNSAAAFVNGVQSGANAANVPATVVGPNIPFSLAANNKTVIPISGDAGDLVTYTVNFTADAPPANANAVDAFDVRLLDNLGALPGVPLINLAITLPPTFGVACLAPTVTNNSTPTTVDLTFDRIRTGCSVTLTYTAQLAGSVAPGQVITNTASLTYTSLPGLNGTTVNPTGSSTLAFLARGDSGGLNGERNGSGGVNSYFGSDTASVSVFSTPEKTIIDSSESSTGLVSGSQRVAIGEIVRYRLTYQLAEGVAPNLRFVDNLPVGLQYLNDGTAKVAFVSNGAGVTSSTLAGAGLLMPGNEIDVGGLRPTFVLPPSAISGGPFGSGTDPTFSLGNVTNDDRDVDQEFVVLELNALVLNDIGNQSTSPGLVNSYQILVGGSTLTGSGATINVAEPVLTLGKAVVPAAPPLDAGDAVTYTLTATNTASGDNSAAAFDIRVTDALDANLELASVAVVAPVYAVVTDSSSLLTDTVDVAVSRLNPGDSVTITVTARVRNDAPAGRTLPNTANLTYTSLPGPNGTTPNTTESTTPGGTGTATGERGGVHLIPGDPNDYAASAPASTTLSAPTVVKQAPIPLSYTIGDLVTYDLLVTLPEGTTPSLRVTDTLPVGLGYVSRSLITSGPPLPADYNGSALAAACPACLAGASGLLTFDFGTPQTNGSGPLQGTSHNQFILRVAARVMNVFTPPAGPNADGNSLTNTASLIYQPAGSDVTIGGGLQTITLVEPRITTTKLVNPLSGVQAGDTLTYTVRFTNSGNAAAYDVTAQDTLAQGVAYDAGSLACVNSVGGSVPSTAVSGAGTLSLDGNPAGSWDIAAGGFIECTYTATALPSLLIDGDHTNTVDADWSSQDGTANEDRQYNDGVAYPFDGSQDTASATFIVAPPVLTKSDGGLTGAVIGQIVSYTLTITSPRGTLQDLTVTDTLPAGLVYLDPPDWSVSGISAPAFSSSGTGPTILTWDFGDALISASPATITFQARVANVAGNQNGDNRLNAVAASYLDAAGGPQSLNASDDFDVLEPDLEITKDAAPPTGHFDEVITYDLTVEHSAGSTADAHDVSLSDVIPAGMTYVAASLSCSGGVGPTCSQSGGTITAAWTSLALGATGHVQYQARLPAAASGTPPGTVFTNNAALTWSSLPTSVANERDGSDGPGSGLNNYADGTSASVTLTGIDLAIVKDDGGATSSAGGTITYTLTYRNRGNEDASGVLLSDSVPVYSLFNLSLSTAGWSCADGAPAGSLCTFSPDVGAGAGVVPAGSGPFTVDFALTVIDPLPAGVTQVTNTAIVSDDGTHGEDPDTPADPNDDNSSTDSTPVAATPDLAITKDDGLDGVAPGATLVYTLEYQNIGTQDATGVVIAETVPVGTTFNAPDSLPTVWTACANGAPAGSNCTFAVGDLDAGDGPFQIRFAVTVLAAPGTTTIDNTVTIDDDGANGPDQDPSNNSDLDIDHVVTGDDLSKTLGDTNQVFTSDPDVAIGEILTYEVTLLVPPNTTPGTPSLPAASLADALDQGLAFVACESILPAAGVTTSLATGFDEACNPPANPSVDVSGPAIDHGRNLVFSLGDVGNTTGAPANLVIRYTAVVLNAPQVGRGDTLQNHVTWAWTGGSHEAEAGLVTVIEPTLTLAKTATPTSTPPGGVITFTLTVAHASSSDSPAFDLELTDVVPVGLTYLPGTLTASGGGVTDDSAAPTLRVTWTGLAEVDTETVTFQATMSQLPPGTQITNNADLIWSGLPDFPNLTDPQSDYNEFSTERVYDPGVDADVTVTLPALPATGFAPGRITQLPPPPSARPYADLGDLWLEIPSLDLELPIVGVPAGEAGWDLTWLWDQAGYLEGTAFPTRPGNSALTGHVYLPNGLPGPFLKLKDLSWGQRIIVHYGAARYVYEVRQLWRVVPTDLSVLRHEEQPWLTLITCEGYRAERDRYAGRFVVRAVLIEVRE